MHQDDLIVLLRSRIPLIAVETRDEIEVLTALTRASKDTTLLPLFRWSVTDGLKRYDVDVGVPQRTLAEPIEILKHLRATTMAGTYALLDFQPYLHDPTLVRLIKDVAQDYERCARTLVFVGCEIEIPKEIAYLTARCSLALPDQNGRRKLVEEVARQWMHDNPRQAIKIDPHALALLIENMNGLTASDTRRLALKAIYDDGALTQSDIPAMMRAKYELLNHNGILRYVHDTAQLADVGGLSKLKVWLDKRRDAFNGAAPDLDPPKGLLLLGVQGCGKSLAARASANIFGVPLLRLDCGALFDKFVGESERNLRESLNTADLLAPCVLWIDEVEKGFASGEADGGATRRVLGTFLTWLSEKNSRVFVVATANDITALPPELVRKGRFDEIFFIDLPNLVTRAEILRIHAVKRGFNLDPPTLLKLAEACHGFAGSEIEQAIVATLYTAHSQKSVPSAQLLSAEIAATRPLEVVMAEKVGALREWAEGRTVNAD